ncbi:hypothetical protein EIP86_010173 [Pleurotus ostreatoroseus]|nr:hypothetical protein EIP86_010173 [Pleurotus ostreatoroseus]
MSSSSPASPSPSSSSSSSNAPSGGAPWHPSGREVFDASLSGAQTRPFLPHLRSDPPAYQPVPHNLLEFRAQEGRENREHRLRTLWLGLPKRQRSLHDEYEDEQVAREVLPPEVAGEHHGKLTKESAKRLEEMYQDELLKRFRTHTAGFLHRNIGWKEFEKYADAKEAELWHIFHDELDLDGNGHIDVHELTAALSKAGISLEPTTLTEFMTFLTSSPHSHAISFQEFRDFLLLLPRKASTAEIFRYYKVKKFMGDDGRGPARVNMEGDVSLSAEDMSPTRPYHPPVKHASHQVPVDYEEDDLEEDEELDDDDYYLEGEDEEEPHSWIGGSTAAKFLLAGGVAGAGGFLILSTGYFH